MSAPPGRLPCQPSWGTKRSLWLYALGFLEAEGGAVAGEFDLGEMLPPFTPLLIDLELVEIK